MNTTSKQISKIGDLISAFRWDVGVDLGSSNIMIYLKDRGIVVDEPTMVVRHKKKRWTGLSAPRTKYLGPIACGFKAKEMVSREPKQIEVVSPIKNGMVSDLEVAESLISYYLKLVYEIPGKYPKIFKPRVVVGVPGSVTDVQKRAVMSIFKSAGASRVTLLEESVLAAIGVGLPVDRLGLVIVDIGGGKTEVSVVSMGGVVISRGIKMAGNDLDAAIGNYLKMKYGILVGPNTAERVKIEVGNVVESPEAVNRTSLVRGRDLETGLPKSIKVTEAEVREAISLEVIKIIRLVKEVLDETPPEMMEEILRRGIVMVGNGSKLRGLSKMIEEETKINTRVAEQPGLCVIKGCGELVESQGLLSQVRLVSGLGG